MRFISRANGGDTDMSRDHEYTDWDRLTSFAQGVARALGQRAESQRELEALGPAPAARGGETGALVAPWTGHEEGERFEDAAGPAIEAPEEAATAFTVAAGVTLAVAAAGLALRRGTALTWLAVATIAAGGVAASLALRAGHAGGELVFVHGLGGSRAAAMGEREKDAD